MARERTPKKLDDAVDGLLRRLDRSGQGRNQARAARAWKKVAGESITRHASGAFLRGKTLVVNVDSAVWAAELQAMSERFREAVNSEIGEDLVSGVRFVVSRQVSDMERAEREREEQEGLYRPEEIEPVPVTPEEEAAIREETERISDPRIREAAFRARMADLGWKKGVAARKGAQRGRGGSTGARTDE